MKRPLSILVFLLLAGMALTVPPLLIRFRRHLPFSGGTTGIRTDRPVTDFQLTNRHKKRVRLSDLAGRFRYVFFGFTRCPSACPATLGLFRRLEKQFIHSGRPAPLFLFISIDPEYDRSDILDRYFQGFSDSFLPLTGENGEIEQVSQEFRIQSSHLPIGSLEHTPAIFLINPAGHIVLLYPVPPADAQTMLADFEVMEETNL